MTPEPTVLRVKGMVCRHCVEAVKSALRSAGIEDAEVDLGTITLPPGITSAQLTTLQNELDAAELNIIHDAEEAMVERTKMAIIDHVRTHACKYNLSSCLSSALDVDYNALSKLFSAREGRTIEKYTIAQRVEYVKELISYGELSLTEIADRTGYSSVAHLSRQFKSITGMTPTAFLTATHARLPIDRL